MKPNTRLIKAISKVHSDYQSIENDRDLCARKITLAQYNCIPPLILELNKTGKAKTFHTELANYFKRFGFNATLDNNGVNYIID